jgi:hypothetical protein
MVVFHFDGEDGPVAPQRLHAAQKNVSLGSLHVKMGKGEALVTALVTPPLRKEIV